MAGKNPGGKKGKRAAKGRSGAQRRGRAKKGSARGSKDLVDHRLMKALAKPERARILAILAERLASPKEVSEETGKGLSIVSYHVKILRESGLIKLDHKAPRRGAVEHFYRAADRALLPPDAWDNLPPAMREGVSACILREFFDDASGAIEAGIFDDPASDLSWTPLLLDRIGVEEVGQKARDFLKAVFDVQDKASKRLAAGNGKGAAERISATVFLASFLSARSPKHGKKASATLRR